MNDFLVDCDGFFAFESDDFVAFVPSNLVFLERNYDFFGGLDCESEC